MEENFPAHKGKVKPSILLKWLMDCKLIFSIVVALSDVRTSIYLMPSPVHGKPSLTECLKCSFENTSGIAF